MGRHKEWRKVAKKLRRKRVRKQIAQKREENLKKQEKDMLNCGDYLTWLAEQRTAELFAEEEEQRLAEQRHKEWLEKDAKDHQEWIERQKRLAEIRLKKAQQQMLIEEEWAREEKKRQEEKECLEKKEEKIKHRQEELLRLIDEYIAGSRSDLPAEAREAQAETQPGRPDCPFFCKMAACRFGDECSRNHRRPAISRILLFSGLYSHFSMSKQDEHDTDIGLEFENEETYKDFIEFFADVVPELDRCGGGGKLMEVIVCCNNEIHIRGNVYAEYSNERAALKAYRAFNGRWYGGKQLNVEFAAVASWRQALCGLFKKGKCPKGTACNFLHAFQNPYRVDSFSRRRGRSIDRSERDDWRWSESPEPEVSNDQKRDRRPRHQKSGRMRKRNSSRGKRESPRERQDSSRVRQERSRERQGSSRETRRSLREMREISREGLMESRNQRQRCSREMRGSSGDRQRKNSSRERMRKTRVYSSNSESDREFREEEKMI